MYINDYGKWFYYKRWQIKNGIVADMVYEYVPISKIKWIISDSIFNSSFSLSFICNGINLDHIAYYKHSNSIYIPSKDIYPTKLNDVIVWVNRCKQYDD